MSTTNLKNTTNNSKKFVVLNLEVKNNNFQKQVRFSISAKFG